MKREVLRIEKVTYKEGDAVYLHNFSMHIMEGEIVGLQPMDTQGLEELLCLLKQNVPLYYGYVYYMEQMVNSWRDRKKSQNRISIISGESTLINGQSIVSNIFVLRAGFRQEILNNAMLEKQLEPFLEDIGLKLDPETLVEKLSPLERVVVEILRAVVAGHHLIVLKEISTVISESELESLKKIIRHYAEKGFSFLYISLHFEEMKQLCSRVALMSSGRIFTILDDADLEKGINRLYYKDYYNQVLLRIRRTVPNSQGEVVFRAEEISGKYLQNFSFEVRKGECLVIHSLDTGVYKELSSILQGKRKCESMRLYCKGKRVRGFSKREMAFLKEKPEKSMLFQQLSIEDNLCIALDRKLPSIWRKKNIRNSVLNECRRVCGTDFRGKRTNELTSTELIQLVYMRIYLEKPDIVFLGQPFQGAGIDLRKEIWLLMELLLKRGIAVVILAVNMADSLSIADRLIRVGYMNGRMTLREYQHEEFSRLPINMPWVDVYDEFITKNNEQEEK